MVQCPETGTFGASGTMSTTPSRKRRIWSEEEYLGLDTNRLVEFSNGYLKILGYPTCSHQEIAGYLLLQLSQFVKNGRIGRVLFGAFPVRLSKGEYRTADIVFMSKEHAARQFERFWDGADLVIEVLSHRAAERRHDLVTKRREYARAGISEYWIVDPKNSEITVLRLGKQRYIVAGKYGSKEQAQSVLLPGFEVNVASALAGK